MKVGEDESRHMEPPKKTQTVILLGGVRVLIIYSLEQNHSLFLHLDRRQYFSKTQHP